VAELTGDYRVRAHNPLEEEAIWRCGTGYLSGRPLFLYLLMIFACFTVLHYGEYLCTFENDENAII